MVRCLKRQRCVCDWPRVVRAKEGRRRREERRWSTEKATTRTKMRERAPCAPTATPRLSDLVRPIPASAASARATPNPQSALRVPRHSTTTWHARYTRSSPSAAPSPHGSRVSARANGAAPSRAPSQSTGSVSFPRPHSFAASSFSLHSYRQRLSSCVGVARGIIACMI
jgi:hypothetical protein